MFTAYDRCDSCGAAAMVRVGKDGKTLEFCGHHANKYAETLTDQGFTTVSRKEEQPV